MKRQFDLAMARGRLRLSEDFMGIHPTRCFPSVSVCPSLNFQNSPVKDRKKLRIALQRFRHWKVRFCEAEREEIYGVDRTHLEKIVQDFNIINSAEVG